MQTKFLRYSCDTFDNLSFQLIPYCSYKHNASMTECPKNVVTGTKEVMFT